MDIAKLIEQHILISKPILDVRSYTLK